MNGADAYAGARLSTLDAISTGVTTVTDWSHAFNPDFARGNLKALTDSRQRFVFAFMAGTDEWVAPEVRRVRKDVIDRNPLARTCRSAHTRRAGTSRTSRRPRSWQKSWTCR